MLPAGSSRTAAAHSSLMAAPGDRSLLLLLLLSEASIATWLQSDKQSEKQEKQHALMV
jgi:hypothetical protein